MRKILKTILQVLLFPLFAVLAVSVASIGWVYKRENEEIEELMREDDLIEVVEMDDENDDEDRNWLLDLSCSQRGARIMRWHGHQSSHVKPIRDFRLWAAERLEARRN